MKTPLCAFITFLFISLTINEVYSQEQQAIDRDAAIKQFKGNAKLLITINRQGDVLLDRK